MSAWAAFWLFLATVFIVDAWLQIESDRLDLEMQRLRVELARRRVAQGAELL